MSFKKVWLVKFPTHLYVEDVKQLAKKNELKVIDSRYGSSVDDELVEKKPPKLTLKNKPKQKE